MKTNLHRVYCEAYYKITGTDGFKQEKRTHLKKICKILGEKKESLK